MKFDIRGLIIREGYKNCSELNMVNYFIKNMVYSDGPVEKSQEVECNLHIDTSCSQIYEIYLYVSPQIQTSNC